MFDHGRFLELVMFSVPGYFEKNAHPVFLNTLPPLPPISMLLPTVLPAVAEIRANEFSRGHLNIEIGGSGGVQTFSC